MPEGSISDHLHAGKSFDERECKHVLSQSSDALAYLHSQDPQIVHRDVKPSNILVLCRRSEDFFIKFADFGISHEGDTPKTFWGTYAYLAPEVYGGKGITQRRRPTYTALVDVWSLGVVLARLLCGLPKQGEMDENLGAGWCKSVRERVELALRQRRSQGQRRDLLLFVLQSMLCLSPHERETAAECHKEALKLLFGSNSVPESDSERGEADAQHQQSDTEVSTIIAGKTDADFSSLSRYIIRTEELLGHQPDTSCKAPSPRGADQLHAGQLLEKLRNPQDSLFYKSSFGGGSGSDSGSNCSISAPATVIVARDTVVKPQVEEQEHGEENRPSDAPIREALVNFLNNGTGTARRSRPTSRSSGSRSPWVLLAGGADGSEGDGLSTRTAARKDS
ncbi:kinase-like domain-containing protein [Stachybotrys elegans]|uniref:non-specific serine/threonine protein kinase n=1 Tax=Stachybotrys elegans TaxID=80388 RepID=A0A8K0WLM0_9HYPO|nr:kinase-like domain-containing protein [Stachybotrys elegans]